MICRVHNGGIYMWVLLFLFVMVYALSSNTDVKLEDMYDKQEDDDFPYRPGVTKEKGISDEH